MSKVAFVETCAGCGSGTYVLSLSPGSVVTCSRCDCTGTIEADADGYYCLWNEELCRICLDGLIERIKQKIAAC